MYRCNMPVQETSNLELSWEDVRIFGTLLKTKSLAAAARALSVDRSTMSRRVTLLEQALGTRLFLRTREGLKPSAAAERIRPHVEKIESEIRGLKDAAAGTAESLSGTVRVATTEALGTFLVQRGLLDIQKRHPGIEIVLDGGNRPVDLSRGEADIALRLYPVTEAALKARSVARLEFGLYASADYIAERGRPRKDEGLQGHALLVPGGELKNLPEAKWLLSHSEAKVIFRSTSMLAIVAACAAGKGLAVLPQTWAEIEPQLIEMFALPHLPKRTIWLVVSADSGKRPEVRVIVEHLAELVAAASGKRR